MNVRYLPALLFAALLLHSCGSPGETGPGTETVDFQGSDSMGRAEVDSTTPIIHVKEVVDTSDVLKFDWGYDGPGFDLAPE